MTSMTAAMTASTSILLSAGLPQALAADAWGSFKQRCLDPFETASAAGVNGLDVVVAPLSSKVHSNRSLAYGPTGEGTVVVIDPTPPSGGHRSCSVTGKIADRDEIATWVAAQLVSDRYVATREGAATVMLSLRTIEPRLQITLVLEGVHAGDFSVLEKHRAH